MAEFEPIAAQDDAGDQIQAETLVVGGGIAGMTAAIETAELGKKVILVERDPSLGGRVVTANQYFPKLCPPTCGMEINLKRIRSNPNVRILTLAEVESVSGSPGDYEVRIKLNPRYVNDKCTCCGECEKVCEIERDNDFNYGIDKTKAIYLPHFMAYPHRYVVDPQHAGDDRMKKCVEACDYDAIELDMQPRTITAKVGGIVWATGWKPYDATKLDNLGFGKLPNVITNVMMERYASENGPTEGKIVRPIRRRRGHQDRFRAVRRLPRREPPPLLLRDLLPGLDEAGHLCPRAIPGRRGTHILHRRTFAGPNGGLLHQGPGGREILLPPRQGGQDHRGLQQQRGPRGGEYPHRCRSPRWRSIWRFSPPAWSRTRPRSRRHWIQFWMSSASLHQMGRLESSARE